MSSSACALFYNGTRESVVSGKWHCYKHVPRILLVSLGNNIIRRQQQPIFSGAFPIHVPTYVTTPHQSQLHNHIDKYLCVCQY